MENEEENLLVEKNETEQTVSENTGTQPVEETVEGTNNATKTPTVENTEKVEEKMFTQADLDRIVQQRIRRIKKDADNEKSQLAELDSVLKAGLGTTDTQESIQKMRDFYVGQGVKIPERQALNEQDIETLAKSDANLIIQDGYDEIVEETNKLMSKGVDKMTTREKYVFKNLAEERKKIESVKELKSIGVQEDVFNNTDFKDFIGRFKDDTPIKDIYEIYSKTVQPKETPKPIGSMLNNAPKEDKTYYTPEEVDKLTAKDYDDPKVMENVRKSMLSWK